MRVRRTTAATVALVTVVLLLLLLPVSALAFPPYAPPFSDVDSSTDFDLAITNLEKAGVVEGYGDGTFRPEASLLRAQMAKMLVAALGLPIREDYPLPPFADLGPDDPASLYPHEYVKVAKDFGITNGTSATTFSPYLAIPRCQAVTMAVRAVDDWGLSVPPTIESLLSPWGRFSATHEISANIAALNSISYGLHFATDAADPWDPMTRAEAALLTDNVMKTRAAARITDLDWPGPDGGYSTAQLIANHFPTVLRPPLFLPLELPAGFSEGEVAALGTALSYTPLGPDPHLGFGGAGGASGYGVAFTNGTDQVLLAVNPGADVGESEGEETPTTLEGTPFYAYDVGDRLLLQAKSEGQGTVALVASAGTDPAILTAFAEQLSRISWHIPQR